jgi:hypothetical protein
MVIKEEKYGLLHKKNQKIVGYTTWNNNSDSCEFYELSEYQDNEWLVPNKYLAEYVRNNSTEYYNADYTTPKHNFKANELEVVKVVKEITITEEKVELPDINVLFTDRYGDKEKEHLKYLLDKIEKGEVKNYDVFALNDYLRKNKMIEKGLFE